MHVETTKWNTGHLSAHIPGTPSASARWLSTAATDGGAKRSTSSATKGCASRVTTASQSLAGPCGCAYYAHLLGPDPDRCLAAQEEDLRAAAKALSQWFTGMRIEAYMAMRNAERLSFHPVAVS